MKKKEIQDLRGKTQAELKKKAEDKRLELSKIVVNLKASKEKNLKKAKNLRRELAQILTVLREKEILERDEL
ncbi:50S ribosomal protein L29 [Candidatus Woesebacteria bacterium RIFCSPHIGHO2_01_FULL_39_17]|uniref:Large ribosomal subunit protein uL29 n=4 Tax=Microgenomates group TaxID=1794810 RepID=A0A0H4TAL4_9BACT|nr:hypothetical protein [uncultured Microgenomates bacterium Rifle_16ft_4_minimus_954]KKQ51952.1 MAG: coiled-coil [Microgenomates group bacterium GW2011_GWC1_38_12]KKQ94384.1 MAG: 50S ribosomal protein L29 [Candidatus Woesebacteria bacterium GW2011_GWB1_39_10b]KKR14396.1 MAG: 50S ribosomal protein L29 [Candidatus Woesebacteria bacterium GW2011_GWA1_39_21b]OGM23805.1 MAG: 50S ribosomal protein L29 [Candidatus Woesebacteria bacterium RIFCSPHIGHO2_01_FULL_39_17]OGM61229.1 MAG: 50S ribosomal prote